MYLYLEYMLTLSSLYAHTSRARLQPQMAAYHGPSGTSSKVTDLRGENARSVSNAGQPAAAHWATTHTNLRSKASVSQKDL